MTTQRNQKDRTREDSNDSSRIPKELEDELKNRKLESESDFLFVEELEDMDGDLVEVTFETPFSREALSQKFSKPGSESQGYASLSNLYRDVGADITEPKSILSVSVPRDLDIIDIEEGNSTNSDWIDNDMYKKRSRSYINTIGSGLSLTTGFASAVLIFSGTILSSLLAFSLAVTGIFLAYSILSRNLRPPIRSSPVYSPTDIEEGDTLILDKNNPTKKKDREVCRVLGKVDKGIEVMLRDGGVVAVDYKSLNSEWVIHDYSSSGPPVVNDGYSSAYVLD